MVWPNPSCPTVSSMPLSPSVLPYWTNTSSCGLSLLVCMRLPRQPHTHPLWILVIPYHPFWILLFLQGWIPVPTPLIYQPPSPPHLQPFWWGLCRFRPAEWITLSFPLPQYIQHCLHPTMCYIGSYTHIIFQPRLSQHFVVTTIIPCLYSPCSATVGTQ